MKKIVFILCFLSLLISGCSSSPTTSNNQEEIVENSDDYASNVGTITLGDSIKVTGQGVSVNGTTITITQGGDFTVEGTLTDGMIYINTTQKVKLRLNNASITNSSGPAIFAEQSEKLLITLVENSTNYLEDGSSYTVDAKATIFSNDDIEIKGSGRLEVVGNYKHGICSDDDLVIENGKIVITAFTDGLHANDTIQIIGGTLDITAKSDAIESENEVIIDDGFLTINADDDGIHAAVLLTINGGKIDIESSYEGLESKDQLVINGGTLLINSSDDAINTGVDLFVNGGSIYATCDGDGIDSNGNITINGGTTVVYSGSKADGPLDIGDGYGYTYIINGGTVFASGGNMGITVSDSSSQASLWISGNYTTPSTIEIVDSSSVLFSETILKSGTLLYFSSPSLSQGETYTINKDSLSLGTITLNGTSASLGNVNQGFQGGSTMPNDGGFKKP